MDLQQRLQSLLADLAPANILWVAGEGFPNAPPQSDDRPVTRATRLADVPAGQIHDFAVVDSAAPLPASEVPLLLSRLRDIAARRVLAVVRPRAGDVWSRRAMIGYGYTAYGEAELDADHVLLYQFDIATYKHTPDWLGPRHWAHPERWDQERW